MENSKSKDNGTIGAFTFVLHSHLPYVLFHGRWPHGTDWLFEAAAETYVPLLNAFNRLLSEGLKPKVTIGITPILAEQLASAIFKDGFTSYLKEKIIISENDIEDFTRRGEDKLLRTAEGWKIFYTEIFNSFKTTYNLDIVGEFARLQNEGALEIITCAATHGYLPLLGYDQAIRAQIRLGVETHKKHFGKAPKGIWLPECAYRPSYFWEFPVEESGAGYMRAGVEEILNEEGIDYFIVDSHLLEGGQAIGAYLDRFRGLKDIWDRFESEFKDTKVDEPRPPYKPYMVVFPNGEGTKRGASIFTRDPKTALVVWSGEHGYPGDSSYLDFHKKHFPGGNRYWKVTGPQVDLGDKEIYEPGDVPERLKENALHFVSLVKETLKDYRDNFGEPGIITAPYDTELFGHWWFEGTTFIYNVLKELATDPEVQLTTLSEYYKEHPPKKTVSIPEGSWGEGGFHWIWFNDWTRWTWKHIYEVEGKMVELSTKYADTDDPGLKKLLNQMGRELLLMESSDWQFLISTWAARDYAEMRFSEHYNDFKKLLNMAELIINGKEPSTGDWELLGDIEKKDTPFPDIDISLWGKRKGEV